jgi:hypothetical protein
MKSLFIDLYDSFDENGPSPLDVVVHILVDSRVNKEQALWMEVLLVNSKVDKE